MTNSTKNYQPTKIVSEESTETGLSIYEIKTIYKKLNHKLIEVMARFEDILSRSQASF